MREARLSSLSSHAVQRLAQRNLSATDVHYVYRHGRIHHTGKATFVHLGLRDIPADDRRDDRVRHLEDCAGPGFVYGMSSDDCLSQSSARQPRYPAQTQARST